MAPFDSFFRPESSEFLALCQSQLALLTQVMGATWTAVYLTDNWDPQTTPQLIPVAVYPNTAVNWEKTALPELLAQTEDNATFSLSEAASLSFKRQKQIVLPLLYENMVMGVLVTRREEKGWEKLELVQLEKIAQTIAIGCLLDQRQSWYEEKFSQLQQWQKQEQNRLDDFLHQLRNPLTALRTFGKLLLKRLKPTNAEDSERNYQLIEAMNRETAHLEDLITQFSQATKSPELLPENQQPYLLPASTEVLVKPLEIAKILAPLIDSAQTLAETENIKLTNQLATDLPLIQGNEQALREVVQNILDNALKYTPAGGQVTVSSPEKQGYQGIAIADTGYGIPPADQQRLFERHYRGVQAEGEIPGTGLGLAIAKELVEQMQGTIEVISPNSPSNCGTTFIVWLPLAVD